jgi:hypothetical protein
LEKQYVDDDVIMEGEENMAYLLTQYQRNIGKRGSHIRIKIEVKDEPEGAKVRLAFRRSARRRWNSRRVWR